MYAARAGKSGTAERLLKAGANATKADFTGRTVLDWATEGRDARMIAALKRAGAK